MDSRAVAVVTVEPGGLRAMHVDHVQGAMVDADPELLLTAHATAEQTEPGRPTTSWRRWARRGFTGALVETVHALGDEGMTADRAIRCLAPLIEWGKRSFAELRGDRARLRA